MRIRVETETQDNLEIAYLGTGDPSSHFEELFLVQSALLGWFGG